MLICQILYTVNIILVALKIHQNVFDDLNGIVDSFGTLFMDDRCENLPLINNNNNNNNYLIYRGKPYQC